MTAGDWPQAVTQPEIMNARFGPGLAYDVITTLPQGTRANIIGVDPRGEWYQLELSDIEIPVWIFQSLANVEGSLDNVSQVSAEELALLPISGAPGSRPVAVIQPEVMNVRLGPELEYEVLTTLPQGTQVNIVGIDPSGEWLQVELEGMTSLGWLYRDLVQVDCPLVNVRRITEREISLQPAAITQPYALYAFSGPGLAYDIVAVLPRGTWAEIIAIGDCPPTVWYQLEVAGLDEPVWVPRDFVKVAVGSLAGIPLYGVTDFDPPADAGNDRPHRRDPAHNLERAHSAGTGPRRGRRRAAGDAGTHLRPRPQREMVPGRTGRVQLTGLALPLHDAGGRFLGQCQKGNRARDCGAAGRTHPAAGRLRQVGSGHGVQRGRDPAEGHLGHHHRRRPAVPMGPDPGGRHGRAGLGSLQSGEDYRLSGRGPPDCVAGQPVAAGGLSPVNEHGRC